MSMQCNVQKKTFAYELCLWLNYFQLCKFVTSIDPHLLPLHTEDQDGHTAGKMWEVGEYKAIWAGDVAGGLEAGGLTREDRGVDVLTFSVTNLRRWWHDLVITGWFTGDWAGSESGLGSLASKLRTNVISVGGAHGAPATKIFFLLTKLGIRMHQNNEHDKKEN